VIASILASAADNLVALAVSALCVAYLIVVLVVPEKF
jgi:hypothetical protein